MSSAHILEFITKDIPLRLLCTSHKSSVSNIWHVLQPIHTKHRGSTQYGLQSLSCFSPFFSHRLLNFVYQSYHDTSWAIDSWILTYCFIFMDCPSLTAYTYFPTSASGYFPPLMYFRTSGLGFLNFHGSILTFFESTSTPCINFISVLTAFPTAIELLELFTMDRVTRHLLSVRLLVPCQPVLLEPFEVLSGTIWCDRMQN